MADKIDEVLAELRAQGWTIEATSKMHYKCFPVDKTKDVTVIARSGDPFAIRNALRELRQRGFIWPPPDKKSLASQRRERTAEELGEYDIPLSTVLKEQAKGELEAPKSLDQLYNELKDAKTMHQLLVEDLANAQKELIVAQAAVEAATKARIEAEKTLAEKKAAFDRAFSTEAA